MAFGTEALRMKTSGVIRVGAFLLGWSVLSVLYQNCSPGFQDALTVAKTVNADGSLSSGAAGSYAFIVQDGTSGLTVPTGSTLLTGSSYLVTLIGAPTGARTISWSIIQGSGCALIPHGASGNAEQMSCSQAGLVTVLAQIDRGSGTPDQAAATFNLATPPAAPSVPLPIQPPGPAPSPPPVGPDGPGLYAQNCADCHGALAVSNKRGRSAAQIQSAISANRGGMGGLNGLSATEIRAIATALQ
jgi:mono/diheme cytochrome c family protein